MRTDPNDKVIEKLQSTGLYNSVRLEDSLLSRKGGEALCPERGGKSTRPCQHLLIFRNPVRTGISDQWLIRNVAGSMKEL